MKYTEIVEMEKMPKMLLIEICAMSIFLEKKFDCKYISKWSILEMLISISFFFVV